MPGFPRVVIAAAVGAFLAGHASAQQATQSVQAAQQSGMQQTVEGGIAADALASSQPLTRASELDSDIGEIVPLEPDQKYEPFSAWTNWNMYWTSNAELLDYTAGSDGFLMGTVGGSYVPQIAPNLFGEFTVEQSIFRYARNSDLDFNATTLTAGLIYVIRDLQDLTVYGSYTYDLLSGRGFNTEIYHDHVLSAGLRKSFAITNAQLFYTSLNANFTVSGWPSYALRHEFNFLAGYQANLTRMLRLDLYYQISAQPYLYTDRTDLNQLIGGGLSVNFTDWLSVQALSTLGINNSTESIYSYFAANLGGGIGILVNF